ncbi:hypothetical protein BDV93DRAFT_560878 [Ceratobasidium sp. AG-I]|nr:hypothetical protein BDV93DRAFT_560878 [Ceratobasidium sp. AG-I]
MPIQYPSAGTSYRSRTLRPLRSLSTVTCVDALHDPYIVPALEAGVRVAAGKPIMTGIDKCYSILETVRRMDRHLAVTSNYQYVIQPISITEHSDPSQMENSERSSPFIPNASSTPSMSQINSIADIATKTSSSSLMVYKSDHHFVLVYQSLAGKEHGWAKVYARTRDQDVAKDNLAEDRPDAEQDISICEGILHLGLTSRRHDTAYCSLPKMVVWITNLDVSNGANCLVRTRTLGVTTINFTLHSDIWGSTEADNGRATWIARSHTLSRISSSIFRATDIRLYTQQEHSQAIKFEKVECAPHVCVGLCEIEASEDNDLRLEALARTSRSGG